jgi:hypothetical protein
MAWAICLTNGFITLSSDYLYVLGTSPHACKIYYTDLEPLSHAQDHPNA